MNEIHNCKWTWKEFYPAALVWWNGTEKKKFSPAAKDIQPFALSNNSGGSSSRSKWPFGVWSRSGHAEILSSPSIAFPHRGHAPPGSRSCCCCRTTTTYFCAFLCSVCSWNIKENFFPFQSWAYTRVRIWFEKRFCITTSKIVQHSAKYLSIF